MASVIDSKSGAFYGGIEAGGTKFVCAVGKGLDSGNGSAPSDVHTVSFPTTDPEETLARAIDFFKGEQEKRGSPLAGVGIGSFGPVDLDTCSPSYGYITSTPKEGWADTDVAGSIRRALGVPVGFDTDVNAAALGESRWGAARGLDTFLYLTVGTGIGGGGLANGSLMHGLLHPEMGHIVLPHDRQVDPFSGSCPYHGDCLEGLASGTAMKMRWGQPAQELPPDHPAWPLEAHYLALALANFIFCLSPQRIVLGGGLMQQTHLLPMIRREVQQILSGYIQVRSITDDAGIEKYIVPPGLGGGAGVLGALALAQQAASSASSGHTGE